MGGEFAIFTVLYALGDQSFIVSNKGAQQLNRLLNLPNTLQPPAVSFIVPAHNEQACLERTLRAIHDSAREVGQPYEVIVVDDASTDSTAEIARQNGATVVSVAHRQIAATRNSGARAASGERLFFVDADTIIGPLVVAAALRQMDNGAAGGGTTVRFEDRVPVYAILLLWWINFFMRLVNMTGGAFMFCTHKAFDAVGGFDERLFGAEDAAMCWALKREGPFVVLWNRVLTSGRRVRGMSGLQMVSALVRMAFFPKLLKQRSSVEKVWYESNRETDNNFSSSLAMKLSNGFLLVVMILIVTGPIWLLPWPERWLTGPLGTVRFVSGVVGLHVGLLLWPCAYFLVRILLRQNRWIEKLKLVALIAICVWFAWGNSRDLVGFWRAIL
jgi:glycosyltransferase involved in cell wall biosynthesis